MSTDFQVCEKCKHVYNRRDTSDESPFMSPDFLRSTTCPRCGGKAVWQSSSQVDEISTHQAAAIKWLLVAVVMGVGAFLILHH